MSAGSGGKVRFESIGFVGTAKNTGKTTALGAVLAESLKRGLNVVVTGIGYDGEVIDNLTELPKPRLEMPEGTIVATARAFLESSEAKMEVFKESHVSTALGSLMLARVVKAGKVVVAGPHTRHAVNHMISCLKAAGDLLLIDGSISRLVPLMEADAVVVSTGAARTTDIEDLATEARGIDEVFQIPQSAWPESLHDDCEEVAIVRKNSEPLVFPFGSVLSSREWKEIDAALTDDATHIWIPGLLLPKPFIQWVEKRGSGSIELLLRDPSSLLAGNEPADVLNELQVADDAKVRVSYRRNVPLLSLVVNPFYPRRTSRGHPYEAAYVDSAQLKSKITNSVSVPVTNVLEDGVTEIVDRII